MNRLERDLEQLFVDATMAEGRDFGSPIAELDEAAEAFECSFVDVTYAEAGEFTTTACVPHHQGVIHPH